MKKCMWKKCVFMFTLLLGLVVITSIAFAFSSLKASLPDKGANFSCNTCHVNPGGGEELNPFGIDYSKIGVPAGNKFTDELAKLDSDKDGYTNVQELTANPVTNPGDPKSFPKPRAVKRQGKNPSLWGKIKSE
jgi:hypothetical protein